MFNLEQSIAVWRQQMLAAGIRSPEPIEELESHLREEISRQIQAGATEPQAFASAFAQIGRADLLKLEFKKTTGWLGWLGATSEVRSRRALGLLWFILCSIQLISGAIVAGTICSGHYVRITTVIFGVLVSQIGIILASLIFNTLLLSFGLLASIRLFLGRGGDRTILLLALWSLIVCVSQMNVIFHYASLLGIAWTALYPITIFALWPSKKIKSAME
ncbi:MAG TPA: hypothetical protein VG347_01925 [Verrucomicrobiae bacterium]|nr:hypothetical protein [Verrucomicrobiae bacterium]